jgi:hypothetical protein
VTVDFVSDSLSTPSLNFFKELCAYAREPGGAIRHLAVSCGDFQRGRLDLRPTNMGVWVHLSFWKKGSMGFPIDPGCDLLGVGQKGCAVRLDFL